MTTRLAPYLNFPGNAREAMNFYHSIFGGELNILGFDAFGATDVPSDGVMHAALSCDGFSIYASDAMPGAEQTWGGTRVYCAFMSDDLATCSQWFTKLAEGGTVGQALETMQWGDTFGLVMDRYGIEWMFNVGSAPQG